MQAIPFVKGHGTGNDFVLLPDPDGLLELTAARVQALCDRHRGLGADGVLRVVRGQDTEWFMDYRNADGSIAEMCGNGVRVFARYLVDAELAAPGDLVIGSRAGPRPVCVPAVGDITVDMGPARVGVASRATVEGRAYEGLEVDVGNPHLACVTDVPLGDLDLSVPPGHDPVIFPHGVNVEFIALDQGLGEPGIARVRVHERGVGETWSCGTGTVAAVVALLRSAGQHTGESTVDTLGGRLHVTVDETTTRLSGPAVIVARGELDAGWWQQAG